MSFVSDPDVFVAKPLGRRLRVWWTLRRHWERFLVVAALLLFVALLEVSLDAVRGTVPLPDHVPAAGQKQTRLEQSEWLARCAREIPRLVRPHVGAARRLHELNRHLLCLAASDLLGENAVLLDTVDGGGGVGFAMWLGARLVEGRQVFIAHNSNPDTVLNFPPGAAPGQLMLSKGLSLDEIMDQLCPKRTLQLAAMPAGDPIVHHRHAYTMLKDCTHTKYIALTNVYPEDVTRVNAMISAPVELLASGVDYSYSTPLAAPFCALRLGMLCQRVPWVIVRRKS